MALADEPIAGGRHKVFGRPDLHIIPQTSTVASHLPAIITWPGPRYTPPPACRSFVSFRIAGMFIVGMAGMKNCTLTSASSIGWPLASLTVASSWLSPVVGGSGLMVCGQLQGPTLTL